MRQQRGPQTGTTGTPSRAMASSTTGRRCRTADGARDPMVRRMIRMDFDIEGRPFHADA